MNVPTQTQTTPPGQPEMDVPRAGQLIGERYLLEQPLERGAMGSIWRAEHVRLRAPVAVKFLDPGLAAEAEMRDRFTQEARSAAAVRSAHVVQVFDYGTEGGIPYIAMELLDGENLDARLSRQGRLTPHELVKIIDEVARGLSKAHAMGVVHRDLKPGNIFIAREGEHEITKLIDFGIAKVKPDALNLSQIVGTQLGTLLGTPQYMSPEQMRGSASVDYRTDLWALAIIACECLTGQYPFSGDNIADLTVQICTQRPRAPSSLGSVPPGFDQWFFKATRRTPSKRFESAEQMARALSKLFATAEVSVPMLLAAGRAPKMPSRTVIQHAWLTCRARLGAGIAELRRGALRAADRATTALATLRCAWQAVHDVLPRPPVWNRPSRSVLFASAGLLVLCAALALPMSRGDTSGAAAEPSAETKPAETAAMPALAVAGPERVVLSALPEPVRAREMGRAEGMPPEPRFQEAPREEQALLGAQAVPGAPLHTDAASAGAASSTLPELPAAAPIAAPKEHARARTRPAQTPSTPKQDPIADVAARILQAPEQSSDKSSEKLTPPRAKSPSDENARRTGSARHPFDDRL